MKEFDFETDWPLSWYIYDHERFGKNACICSAETKLSTLINACPRPPRNPDGVTHYTSAPFVVNLQIGQDKVVNTHEPVLSITCSYIPYVEMRRNFWFNLMSSYSDDQTIDKVALTMLLDSLGSTLSNDSIAGFWSQYNKPLDDSLSFDQVFLCVEESLVSPNARNEHLLQLDKCPICKKGVKKRADFDMLAHLAMCVHEDLSRVDTFAMGGLLTPTYASAKWFKKIFSFVTFGGMGIGKNNGNILYQDRLTGRLLEEKIPTYIRLGIRLLYQGAGSKPAESRAIKKLLKRQTMKQGSKFDHPKSVSHIAPFVAYHNLNLDEGLCFNLVLEPMEHFKSFNQFFYRKLRPDARTLCSPDQKVAICPADARTNCFQDIKNATNLWIKGKKFTLASLLNNEIEAKRYEKGSLAIFRLAPQDYHRFHFPVDGIVGETDFIAGTYYTVNPMAVRTTIDVYTENIRSVTYIQSKHFGQVAYICVGAMLVGSIQLTSNKGQMIQRLDEHGYFQFGGSTIILLFEPNKILFDKDLVDNSQQCLETLVRVGQSLGIVYPD